MAGPAEPAEDGVRLFVRLTPGAAHETVGGSRTGPDGATYLKAAVTAPAEGGKANAALVKLLAKTWRLPKSGISIIRGASDRWKVLHIAGEPDALMRQIRSASGEKRRK